MPDHHGLELARPLQFVHGIKTSPRFIPLYNLILLKYQILIQGGNTFCYFHLLQSLP